jgi:hypothetical protein
VKGYPTIKFWDYGEGKTDSKATDFNGARNAAGLISFANEYISKADIQPEIHEITK